MREYYAKRPKRFQGVSFSTTATKLSLASRVSPTDFTACFWLYPTTLSSSKVIFSIDDGAGNHQVSITTATSPAVIVGVDSGAHDSGTLLSLAANTWSFLAVTSSSTGLVGYGKANPESAMVGVSLAFATGATTGTTAYVNGDGLGDTGIIAQYAGLKIFPFVMTEGGVLRESLQLAPVSTGAVSYLPLRSTFRGAVDEAWPAVWTTGGTLTNTLNTTRLPVPEVIKLRAKPWLFVSTPSTSNSATVAQNVGGLQSSATVGETDSASVAQILGGLRSSAAAGETDAATIAQRLGGLRSSAIVNDSLTNSATVAQNLGGLRSAATVGERQAASIAQRVGGLRSAVTAGEAQAAAVAQRLGGLRSAVTVGEKDNATVAQRLGGLRSNATANETDTATVAQRIGGLRSSATANETDSASVSQRLGGLRSSASAGMASAVTAVVAQSLGGLRSSAAVSSSSGPTRPWPLPFPIPVPRRF